MNQIRWGNPWDPCICGYDTCPRHPNATAPDLPPPTKPPAAREFPETPEWWVLGFCMLLALMVGVFMQFDSARKDLVRALVKLDAAQEALLRRVDRVAADCRRGP